MSLAKSTSKLIALAALAALNVAPSMSHATSARGQTFEEEAIEKVNAAIAKTELKYVTKNTSNICGTTGVEGLEVKVVMKAQNGRLVLLRTYGVTYAGVFSSPKAILCK